MTGSLSTAVAAFVRNSLSSVEELELLLLIQGSHERTWTAEAIAKELGSTTESIASRLIRFITLGIVLPSGTEGQAAFRYSPKDAMFDGLLHEVALAYRQRRIAMIALIYEHPNDTLHLFSDAFRLRKDGPK
jgi:hypothetical protein